MRPTKYRAYHKKEKKMWTGQELFKCSYFINPKNGKIIDSDGFVIKEFIPLLFTGHRDKNEKEIYKGDIIENLNYQGYPKSVKNMTVEEKIKNGWITEVIWENSIDSEYGYQISGFVFAQDSKNYKVIGNIFENPELSKEAK